MLGNGSSLNFWRPFSMRVLVSPIAVALLISPAHLQAESANSWRVNGSISGRTFVLDCLLEQGTGTCTDVSAGGKSKPLTSLTRLGDRTSWSFQTRHLFLNITLAFSGRVSGEHMNGTMSAAGRSGSFAAVRR
jgi:hypothetical protein